MRTISKHIPRNVLGKVIPHRYTIYRVHNIHPCIYVHIYMLHMVYMYSCTYIHNIRVSVCAECICLYSSWLALCSGSWAQSLVVVDFLLGCYTVCVCVCCVICGRQCAFSLGCLLACVNLVFGIRFHGVVASGHEVCGWWGIKCKSLEWCSHVSIGCSKIELIKCN